jgi:hypothetical protein
MTLFAGLAGTVALLIGWLVTHRLFRLARETGAAPERLLAIAFGGLFCVGYPLAAASRAPGLGETYQGSLIFAIAMLGIVVGLAALSRFPYIVFRPDSSWARSLSLAITFLGMISGAGSVIAITTSTTRAETIAAMQPWAIALVASIGIPMLWNAIESTLYHRSMKKRLVLGLADAATTHRFALWAVAAWSACTQIAVILVIRGSGSPILAPTPMAVIAVSSLVGSICWWLAFFMPDAYRTRLEHAAKKRI